MFMVMHAHCEGLIPRRGDYRPRLMILMELKDIDGRLHDQRTQTGLRTSQSTPF